MFQALTLPPVLAISPSLHPLIKLFFIIINFGPQSLDLVLSAIDKLTKLSFVDSLRVICVHGCPLDTI